MKLRGAKFARRHIEQRQRADGCRGLRVGRFRNSAARKLFCSCPSPAVQRRARRKHARHFAAHNLLRELGIFHLVAEGDAVALAQQARQVLLDGSDKARRTWAAALAVAGRQSELQLAAGGHRIVVKELVKVAHAEEQQGIGILALGRGPLAHEGGRLQRLRARLRLWGFSSG